MLGMACLCTFLMSASCSKEDQQESTPQGEKMTVQDLTDGNGKIWWIADVDITYTGASGAVDSTVKPVFPNLETSMWFGLSASGAIQYAFRAGEPLNRYMPLTGSWNLNIPSQLLALKCYDVGGNCTTTKDGVWTIEKYGSSAYGESFHLSREFPLAEGRKMKVWARLYND
ncbi:hypothetical protein EG028_15005 [Chitinophaga barathri]|uniref:Uncharacterized protein n=2 Tax=Chitinophaga barathri TaxID=1647451 RepID=A0A3N4MB30_9BACT|nr:hypothetical protein EG028_15005 [Chitinophaga barathri]